MSSTSTKVLPCNCTNKFQDERYGKDNRLHNATLKPTPGWRCTVCDKNKG